MANTEFNTINVGEDILDDMDFSQQISDINIRLDSLSRNFSSDVDSRPYKTFQNSLTSPNYKSGETGWIIEENGDVEFNDGTFRGEVIIGSTTGQRIKISTNVIESYETNNKLRFRIDGDVIEFYDPSQVLSSALYGANVATDGVDGIAVLLTPSARLTISSITRSGTTATVTTSSAHGASTGWFVTVQGADQTDYNISAEITVTSSTVFTYTVANSPTTPATGTMYCRVYPDYYLFSGAGFTLSGGSFLGDIHIDTGSSNSLSFGGSFVSPDMSITCDDGTTELDVSGSILPTADNTYPLGTAAKRWSDLRSVLINGADIGFANGWKFREWPATKEDIGKSDEWMKENANLGIQLLNNEEELIAVIHKDGYIYCNGIKNLNELI